ncbi:aminotransferase, class I and II [Rhodobacterales bacterium HTCC2150]|nr:aminotransferase, class I and II [Rhodobacterales bacterium HTCC2150] [Rhodobacteraceae bacterium HTCC2150]
MNFDKVTDRRGSRSVKWDSMESNYGVSNIDGIAMWVADTDFPPPACVTNALQSMVDHNVYGYYGDDTDYKASIQWWMKNRHNWPIELDWIFTTFGLVNAVGICVDIFSESDDGVVLFTPVYHAFARVIENAERKVVELELRNENGHLSMDFDAYDAQMQGHEKIMIISSPHNPGGRVWTKDELLEITAFAKRHDLILLSDEIHHDLVFAGNKHIPTALADPSAADRLLTLTAASKTFNVAGGYTGNVIIQDEILRKKFAKRLAMLGMSKNSFGVEIVRAAYSPEGAEWVDELIAYIDGNRRVFDEGINAIPGLKSMPLQSTYLAWVDFSGTGMSREEFTDRVEKQAKIAANHGTTFGKGGDNFLRFNLGAPRSVIEEAVSRLQAAFSDLQ